MAANYSVIPPFETFRGVDGTALDTGYIYIGTASLDPVANPIAVFWDAAGTIPAPQPIRTQNGYPSRGGSPAAVYVGSDYSILVTDKKGQLVYSAPTANNQSIAFISNLANTSDPTLGDALIGMLQTFVNAVATTLHEWFARRVEVFDFLTAAQKADVIAYTYTLDCSAAIQSAIEAAKLKGGAIVTFRAGGYKTTLPIYSYSNVTLQGEGMETTIVKKTTNTVGSGTNTWPGVAADSYAVDAILIVKHNDGTYATSISIKDMEFIGPTATPCAYGIYTPRTTRLDVQRVFVQYAVSGFWTYNTFMSNFNMLMCWNCTYGFVFGPDNTGIGMTSCHFANCYALQCSSSGFKFNGMNYFEMDNCGADQINVLGAALGNAEAAYSILSCTGFSINGCGAEGNKGQTFSIQSSNGAINGHQTYSPFNPLGGSLGLLYIDGGSRVTFNSCAFSPLVSTTGASASFATNVMTCTVAPGYGTFAVGDVIIAAGVATGTTITSLGTGTGGLGTYNLSTSPGTIAAAPISSSKPLQTFYNILLQGGSHAIFINTPLPTGGNTFIGYGGGSTLVEYSDAGFPKINGVAQFDQAATFTPIGASCSFATSVMTCTIAPTAGAFAVGQVIVAAGVAGGTTITSLGTGTGGLGTYNLSTTPGTIAAEPVTVNPWTGLTVVGADTSTYKYQRIGNVVYFTAYLQYATSSVSAGGGATYLTPPAAVAQPAGSAGICTVVDTNTLLNIGNGAIVGNRIYVPSWTARPAVVITGSYTV